jgi:excinuclease ABC subunit C
MFDREENLKQLPASPGVYLHKDANGEVIYVGKASSLKNRVRQYSRKSGQDEKTAALASHIAEFEYIVTSTEAEALLLENTLIKHYRPRYNIMLRDDKTYPYIKITLGEEWPRLLKTRILSADGSKYFGPYADVGAVNRIIALLNDVYRLKRCPRGTFPKGHRPCLHGHIDRCRRVCDYRGKEKAEERGILHEEYMTDIAKIISFLKGNGAEVERYITARMNEASARMDYEEAARWRDYLGSAKAVTEKQRVELLSSGSMDVVLASPATTGAGTAVITVFFVRDGKLVGRERHLVDAGGGAGPGSGRGRRLPDADAGGSPAPGPAPAPVSGAEAVAAFISQHYANQSSPPREILIEEHIPDEQFVAEALSESGGYRVRILVPQRGAKKELLRLARNDADEAVRREARRAEAETKKRERLAGQLSELFGGLPGTLSEGRSAEMSGDQPETLRIEAYDISHTGGADSVGAMVVFTDFEPSKRDYRRFRIRGEEKGDDYAAMQETLYRRLKRAAAGDKGFLPLPDLMLIDGGKGHVSAARQVIEALRVSAASAPAPVASAAPAAGGAGEEAGFAGRLGNIRLAGMVKDDKHRTRALIVPREDRPAKAENAPGEKGAGAGSAAASGGGYDEVALKDKPELFSLVGRIQEETHRFVVDYHQKRRDRTMKE